MNRLILCAVAALSVAGFALPALADASSIETTPSFSAAEFFAEQGNVAARTNYQPKAQVLGDNAVALVRKAPVTHRTVTPVGAPSLTHDDADYSW